MSVVYQGETFEVSNEDLVQTIIPEGNNCQLIIKNDQQIKSELGNLSEELYICTSEPVDSDVSLFFQDKQSSNFESEEDYLLYLESKWNNPTPLTPQEENEWLEYENSRMESDLLESENEWV